MFGKEVRIFLRGQAEKAFLELKRRNDKEAQSILRSIERLKEILKTNPQYGKNFTLAPISTGVANAIISQE